MKTLLIGVNEFFTGYLKHGLTCFPALAISAEHGTEKYSLRQ